jgi:tetratricopeptide (TPR) repeat protein
MSKKPRLTRAELLQRLEQNEGLDDIARSLLSPDERDMLRRAALVRWLDDALWTDVLAKGRTELPLQRLLQSDAIEPVPRRTGVYRMKTGARVEHLKGWFPDGAPSAGAALPDDLLAIERALVAHFQARGDAAREDALYHAALGAPDTARALFDALYAEADAAFDLARCWELLRLLLEGLTLGVDDVPLIPPRGELLALHADRRVYLDVRSHFDDTYYQTGSFLPRPALEKAFEALLTQKDRWILQLFARGGMGKTMSLRWLIARKCVPVPRRIPCAHIDFDHDLDIAASPGNKPWLLAAKLAQHLHGQIAGAAFSTLAREALAYQATAALRSEADRAVFAAEITDRFASALREVRIDKPVLLILDTLEEALFYRQEQLSTALDYLAELHEACPNIRLILAGRYDLGETAVYDGGPRERLPGFQRRFGAVTTNLPVEPFAPEEARRYFVEIRGIQRSDAVEAAIERAEGLPFKVALLADTLQQEPNLGAQEILDYPSVDLVYLIERVVKRIPEPQLRWVLRYGAVPSRLTFSFLRDVMARFLPDATAGVATYDDPTQGLPPRVRDENVFAQGEDVRLPDAPDEGLLRDLWTRLCRFAGTSSWISHDSKRDALTFHSDVVNPMRWLLREHAVFRMLHEAALEHFERLADSDREHRTDWAVEAVYHAFQLRGEEAGSYFRAWIDRARAEGEATRRLALSRALVSSIYVDEGGRPHTLYDKRTILSRATQAEAQYERAAACLDLARAAGEPLSPHWNEAKSALDACERIRAELGDAADLRPSPTQIAVARAKILRNERNLDAALALLEGAAAGAREARDRFALEAERAAVLGVMRREDAIFRAMEAIAAGMGVALAPGELLDAFELLARLQLTFDQHDAAAATCETAIERAKGEAPARVPGLSCLQIDIKLRRGSVDYALSLSDLAQTSTWPRAETIEHACLRARAELLLGDPAKALATVRRALEEVDGNPDVPASKGLDPRRAHELRGSGHELEGAILAASLDVDGALRSFSQARSSWYAWGGPSGEENGARCLQRCIEIALHVARNTQDAEGVQREAEALALPEWSEAAAFFGISRAELSRLSGDHRAADEQLARVEAQIHETSPPHLLVAIALAGLAGADAPLRQRSGQRLVKELGRVDSTHARLALIDGLARCPTGALSTERRPLSLLVLEREPTHPAELARYLLRRVEWARACGERDGARQLLEQARPAVCDAVSPILLRDLLLAFDRLELGAEAWPHFSSSFFDKARPFELFAMSVQTPRLLAGALRLEHAERLGASSPSLAADLAAEADQLLTGAPPAWRNRRAALLDKLAQPMAMPALESQTTRSLRAASAQPLASADAELHVRLDLVGTSQVRVQQITGAQERSWMLDAHGHRFLQEVVASRFSRSSESVSYGLVKMLTGDPRRTVLDIRSVLFDPLMTSRLRFASGAEPITYRLDLGHELFAAVPWELGVLAFDLEQPQSPLGGKLRICRVPAEREPPGDHPGQRRPFVAILQPSAAAEERSRRDSYWGQAIAKLYERFGLEVRIYENPSLGDFVRAVDLSPAVMHVRAGFKEASSHGGVQLDFSGGDGGPEQSWRRESDSEELLPSTLARALSVMEGTPTLILDAYRPAGDTELFRQLLLRNAFAASLQQVRGATPILAAGLLPMEAQEIAYHHLAEHLAMGGTLGEIRERIQAALRAPALEALSTGFHGRGDLAGFAMALFTDDPHFRPVLR